MLAGCCRLRLQELTCPGKAQQFQRGCRGWRVPDGADVSRMPWGFARPEMAKPGKACSTRSCWQKLSPGANARRTARRSCCFLRGLVAVGRILQGSCGLSGWCRRCWISQPLYHSKQRVCIRNLQSPSSRTTVAGSFYSAGAGGTLSS